MRNVAEMNEEAEWSLAPLARARSRLQELMIVNRRKDEFLAILGHELRSPLASIRNAVLILGSQNAEGPVRKRAQALLERQVRHMTRLVDDLLRSRNR